MSTTTTNLGLLKPDLTDPADITAMNVNWDKIDEELKKASDNSGVKVYTATIDTDWIEYEEDELRIYIKDIRIDGITKNHTAMIDCVYAGDGTVESFTTFMEQKNQFLTCITNGFAETGDGFITFMIFGEPNAIPIPIIIEVV